jgi:hypothetical protein
VRAVAITACLLLAPCVGLAAPLEPTAPDWAWIFDDGSGGVATALFGGEDGTLMDGKQTPFAGPTWDTDTPFAYAGNYSLYFDGVNDYVDMPGLDQALEGVSAFSLSAWIRADQVDHDLAFWSGRQPNAADQFKIRYDDEGSLNGNPTQDLIKVGLTIDDGSLVDSYEYESSGGYQTTDWQHIVMTWESGAGLQLYVDGVLDIPSEQNIAGITGVLANQKRFIVGDGSKDPWQGRIDEVGVWKSSLSAENVAWLQMNSMMKIKKVPEPGSGGLAALGLLGIAFWRRFSAAH